MNEPKVFWFCLMALMASVAVWMGQTVTFCVALGLLSAIDFIGWLRER